MSVDPEGAPYAGTELEAMAHAENYYRWIASELAPHLGSRIVEVGAGIGTFAGHLRERALAAELVLVEPAPNNLPRLRERFRDAQGVRVLGGYVEDVCPAGSADTMVAVNVMEHIADDDAFLAAAHRILIPGGRLLLWIPALPWLFGTLDEAFDHYRRYTRPGLSGQLAGHGFRVDRIAYRNLPGVLSWFAAGRILRRRTISARQAKLYDRYVIPVVSAIERRWNPPFGPSLLAIATRLPDGRTHVDTPPPHSPA
jgi:SAM-dependent methyltransferase